MLIKETLTNIKVESMKSKQANVAVENNKTRIAIISVIEAALNKAEKEKKADLTPSEELKIVKKLRDDAEAPLESFQRAGRKDLVLKVDVELNVLDLLIGVLELHVPRQLNEEEISDEIDKVSHDNKLDYVMQNKGAFMKILKDLFKDRADMKTVNIVLSKKLK